jgi:transcriptional regulator
MYRPPAFDETRPAELARLIAATRLAILVGDGPDGLCADHVPVLFDPARGPHGTLVGHLARANPRAAAQADGGRVLAIFAGPDAYVSPGWYPSKAQTGRAVPTWNYEAVHAHGVLRLFDDPTRLLDVVSRLSDAHEAGRATPWSVADAPADFVAAHLKGIVGFEIAIARLEGKRKLSQNRAEPDREGVIAGLETEPGEAAAATAVAMRATLRDG